MISPYQSSQYETGRELRMRRLKNLANGDPELEAEAARIMEEIENQPLTGTHIMRRAQMIAEAST